MPDFRGFVRLSKYLSFLLRHDPESGGLSLDDGGWVGLAEVLEACRANGFEVSRADLLRVVETSDKQRFALSPDNNEIRANQGHSLEVNLGLEPVSPPVLLYHGTAQRFLSDIYRKGLRRMSRQHVHLSGDQQTARLVGERHGHPAVLAVLSGEMYADGHTFLLSRNGVWLTDSVPAQYLKEGEPADG